MVQMKGPAPAQTVGRPWKTDRLSGSIKSTDTAAASRVQRRRKRRGRISPRAIQVWRADDPRPRFSSVDDRWSDDRRCAMSIPAGQKEFLLASMRAAAANLRTWQLEIETIGVGLKNDLMTHETAVERLTDLGLIEYLPNPQTESAPV